MAAHMVSRLEAFFEGETEGELRSIVTYEQSDFEVVYLRDDVAEQYTEKEVADAVDDSRMESLTAPIYEDAFAADHGDLTCMVKCYEHAVEMNFVLADGVGAAVGLDASALSGGHGLIAGAREIVVEERGRVDAGDAAASVLES